MTTEKMHDDLNADGVADVLRRERAAAPPHPASGVAVVTEAMKRAGFDGFQKWCREQSPAYHVDPSSDPYYLNAIGAAIEAALAAGVK